MRTPRMPRRQPRQPALTQQPAQAQPPDFDALIEAAKDLRYDGDAEHIKHRLWQIIERNQKYLDRRAAQGHTGAYNMMVAEDCVAIAAAIKLIGEKP